jgi:hypothetical protein
VNQIQFPATGSTAGSGFLFLRASPLLNQLGDHSRPPRLMAGADTGSRIAVKVLVKQHQIAPVRVIRRESSPATSHRVIIFPELWIRISARLISSKGRWCRDTGFRGAHVPGIMAFVDAVLRMSPFLMFFLYFDRVASGSRTTALLNSYFVI